MKLIVEKSKEKTALPRVFRAAIKLFVKKGYEAATIRDIAQEAQVSEGALYRHFKSKEELAWHIFATHLNDFSIRLLEKVNAEKTTRQKLRAYINMCFETFEDDPDLFYYLIISEHRELKKFPPASLHPGIVALKIVEFGQKNGDVKKDIEPYVAASMILGTLIRLCVVRTYPNTLKSLPRHAGCICDSLWGALKNTDKS